MDLEARSLQPSMKATLLAKVREYKADLNNLKSQVKRVTTLEISHSSRDELLESGEADKLTVFPVSLSLSHPICVCVCV